MSRPARGEDVIVNRLSSCSFGGQVSRSYNMVIWRQRATACTALPPGPISSMYVSQMLRGKAIDGICCLTSMSCTRTGTGSDYAC